jgi:ferredoxin-type protein NapH
MIKKYRFLIARRFTQISIMVLYMIANVYGINILMGNLSSSLVMKTVPLSDPYAVMQMLFAGAVISFDILLGAFLITIFYMIVGGRSFCSWICPVNMITDLANYLRRRLGFNQIQKKQPASRNIRYWVIAISFVLSFIMGIAAFELISPVSMIHRGIVFGLGFGWATMVVIFLFDLFVLKNVNCLSSFVMDVCYVQ